MGRYTGIDTKKTSEGRRYISNPIYPDIPLSSDDFYIISSIGDRYDTLAAQFYGDSRLWWVIASANNYEKASLVVTPGVQLRIPANINEVLDLYDNINSNR